MVVLYGALHDDHGTSVAHAFAWTCTYRVALSGWLSVEVFPAGKCIKVTEAEAQSVLHRTMRSG